MLKFNHREIFCFTKRFYIANIIKIAPQLSWEAIILIGKRQESRPATLKRL